METAKNSKIKNKVICLQQFTNIHKEKFTSINKIIRFTNINGASRFTYINRIYRFIRIHRTYRFTNINRKNRFTRIDSTHRFSSINRTYNFRICRFIRIKSAYNFIRIYRGCRFTNITGRTGRTSVLKLRGPTGFLVSTGATILEFTYLLALIVHTIFVSSLTVIKQFIL